MTDLGTGLTVLGLSAPIVAAIIKFVPPRNGNGYVSKELFNERTCSISRSLDRIEQKLDKHIEHENAED